ncbi:hypothetical protein FBY39_1574 [Microbacterium sp. SLBN-146]|nr:hypothetical protein FBY39_1574 [Microbacterium sp. SLBN-146]
MLLCLGALPPDAGGDPRPDVTTVLIAHAAQIVTHASMVDRAGMIPRGADAERIVRLIDALVPERIDAVACFDGALSAVAEAIRAARGILPLPHLPAADSRAERSARIIVSASGRPTVVAATRLLRAEAGAPVLGEVVEPNGSLALPGDVTLPPGFVGTIDLRRDRDGWRASAMRAWTPSDPLLVSAAERYGGMTDLLVDAQTAPTHTSGAGVVAVAYVGVDVDGSWVGVENVDAAHGVAGVTDITSPRSPQDPVQCYRGPEDAVAVILSAAPDSARAVAAAATAAQHLVPVVDLPPRFAGADFAQMAEPESWR